MQENFDPLQFVNKLLAEQRSAELGKVAASINDQFRVLEAEEQAQCTVLESLGAKICEQRAVQANLQQEHQRRMETNRQAVKELTDQIEQLGAICNPQTHEITDQLEQLLKARFLLQLFNEFLVCRLVGGIALSLEFAQAGPTQFNLFNNIPARQLKQSIGQFEQYSTYDLAAIFAGSSKQNPPTRRIIASPLEDSPLIPPAVRYLLNNPFRRHQMLFILKLLTQTITPITRISLAPEQLFGDNPAKWSLLKLSSVQEAIRALKTTPQELLEMQNETVGFINTLLNEIQGVQNSLGIPPKPMIVERAQQLNLVLEALLRKPELIKYEDFLTQKKAMFPGDSEGDNPILGKYARGSEIFNLCRALDPRKPNFVAARRICKSISALGGDGAIVCPLIFECIGRRLVDELDEYLVCVIKKDIFQISDTDEIHSLKNRLVNLRFYFEEAGKTVNALKKLIWICIEKPIDVFYKALTQVFVHITQRIQAILVDAQEEHVNQLSEQEMFVLKSRSLNLLPCVKLMFEDLMAGIDLCFDVPPTEPRAEYYGLPTYGSASISATSLVSRTSNKLDDLAANVEFPTQLHPYLKQIRDRVRKATTQAMACLVDSNTDLLFAIDELQHDGMTWMDILGEQIAPEWGFEAFLEEKLSSPDAQQLDVQSLKVKDVIDRRVFLDVLKRCQSVIDETAQNMFQLMQLRQQKQVQPGEKLMTTISVKQQKLQVDLMSFSGLLAPENVQAISEAQGQLQNILRHKTNPFVGSAHLEYKLILPNFYVRGLVPPLPQTYLANRYQRYATLVQSFKLQQFQIQHIQALQRGLPEPAQIMSSADQQPGWDITRQPWPSVESISGEQQMTMKSDLARLDVVQLRDKICAALFDSQQLLECAFIKRYDYAKMELEVKLGGYDALNPSLEKFVKTREGLAFSETLFSDLSPVFIKFQQQVSRLIMLAQNSRAMQNTLAQALQGCAKNFFDGVEQKLKGTISKVYTLMEMIAGPYNDFYPPTLPKLLTFKYKADLANSLKLQKFYETLFQMTYDSKKKLVGNQFYEQLNITKTGQPKGFTPDFVPQPLALDATALQSPGSIVYECANKQPNEPSVVIPCFDLLLQMSQSVISLLGIIWAYIQGAIQPELGGTQEVYNQILQLQLHFQNVAASFLQHICICMLQLQFAAFRQLFCLGNYDSDTQNARRNLFKFEQFKAGQSCIDEFPGKPAFSKFVVSSIRSFCTIVNKHLPRPTSFRMICQLVEQFPTVYLAHVSRFKITRGSDQQLAALDELRYYSETLASLLQGMQPINETETEILHKAKTALSALDAVRQALNFVVPDIGQNWTAEFTSLLFQLVGRGRTGELSVLETAQEQIPGLKLDSEYFKWVRQSQ